MGNMPDSPNLGQVELGKCGVNPLKLGDTPSSDKSV